MYSNVVYILYNILYQGILKYLYLIVMYLRINRKFFLVLYIFPEMALIILKVETSA